MGVRERIRCMEDVGSGWLIHSCISPAGVGIEWFIEYILLVEMKSEIWSIRWDSLDGFWFINSNKKHPKFYLYTEMSTYIYINSSSTFYGLTNIYNIYICDTKVNPMNMTKYTPESMKSTGGQVKRLAACQACHADHHIVC